MSGISIDDVADFLNGRELQPRNGAIHMGAEVCRLCQQKIDDGSARFPGDRWADIRVTSGIHVVHNTQKHFGGDRGRESDVNATWTMIDYCTSLGNASNGLVDIVANHRIGMMVHSYYSNHRRQTRDYGGKTCVINQICPILLCPAVLFAIHPAYDAPQQRGFVDPSRFFPLAPNGRI